MAVIVGEEDAEQWLKVARYSDPSGDLVHITYLEGVVTRNLLELPAALAAQLGAELTGTTPAGTQYRASFPAQLTADSEWEHRICRQEEAESLVAYVNGRLAAVGLPEVAYVESRELRARPWSGDTGA